MIAFLKKEEPDILAAQEVYGGTDPTLEARYRSVDVLARELGLPHRFFSPAFLDHRDIGAVEQGNCIFSRFPLRDTRTIFFDVSYDPFYVEKGADFTRTPRNLQCAAFDIRGTTVHVFNAQGIWGVDGEDNERRLRMSDVIVREVAGKPHVILAGDFNVREQTQTVRNVEKLLANVFRGELVTTFNMRRKKGPGFASAVVDMVFASRDLRVVSRAVPDVDVSDHLPLVCEFEVL